MTWVDADSLERAAHALVHDGRVWLVDPFEDEAALARVAELGELAGVLQLFVAHERDGKAIAQRLGAPFLSLPEQVPDSPLKVLRLDSVKVWKERALWWPERKGLVVAESIGTAVHYAVGKGPAGVHMIRRPLPPNSLKSYRPEHLLVGHGRPLHGEEADAGLRDALNRSRRDIPTFVRRMPSLFRSMQGRS
ncbi:hypothetical protein OJ998_03405 [Solirubrobacter taibaiensis]|nr:hypothetical protein [Solirubrobacter taibaiensis]